ncbi:branched-chain amino acid ABC transporter permease/ATP-binding protein [Phytoactinopolyspora halotolerans]|uniref:ATP-binding cassette domain-containing protein n=1 Tax=Phytoactinopolyspora halotolerans TaxID=1981512 RepID=A0A6L9SGZ4_9ACTN|nr:branched-chain amino acid ABC transporter permease/ATP-binding protein [Phytoactinopolyspora halotolerans]NEE04363.1 ATP-binding cassette domain-containing protein [Phytoactinopolyspora halotolerans]
MSAAPVVLGLIMGLMYGLLGVGLVLIYRTSRVINFAHGQVGAFAAILFGLAVVRFGLPYWVMLPLALFLAGVIGAAVEAVVVRRLRHAPRLMIVVATLGVGQFLVMLGAALNPDALGLASDSYFPSPPGLPTFDLGALHIDSAYTGMIVLAPAAVIGIAVFLRRSRFGLAVRAASSNPDAARMAGIPAARMSALTWGIAGVLSALSAILTQAARDFTTGDSFGPNLLLRALACAVLARMSSLPAALCAGVGLGVVEQVLLWNHPRAGVTDVALLVIILVALLLQRRRGGREEEKGSWAAVQAVRPLPPALQDRWLVRHLGHVVAAGAVVLAATIPFVASESDADRINGIIAFMIVGLAVGLLTGLAGQLTLGQFAVAGAGGLASAVVAGATGSFPTGLLAAGATAGGVSVLLGLPSLRVRGLMLAVTTLAFAVAAPTVFDGMLGSGRDPGRPVLPGGDALRTGTEYYWFTLGLLLVALWLAHNARRSGFGRLLRAVRDNEECARAFSVRSSLVKLRGYLLSGFIAGLGGAAYGHSLMRIDGGTFPVTASIDLVVMVVVGGVAVLYGPILGALLVLGLPAFVPLDAAGLAATQLGLLILILYVPGGLAQLATALRDRVVAGLARVYGVPAVDTVGATHGEPETPPGRATFRVATSAVRADRDVATVREPLLVVRDLHKSYGGVQAVAGMSLTVQPGETVGLIGPNGAGKTTLFELIGGFVRPDSGSVRFGGHDVTGDGPERRAQLGLVRSFQDAALFPTMTVAECVMVALERTHPTRSMAAIAGLSGADRRKTARADEVIHLMGLQSFRDVPVRQLSTGTRRIAELACMVALEPRLLLLDEPSSGIAQRETEALGETLMSLKAQLDLTLVVIEHDMPLIMGISDRLVAMVHGGQLAAGTPDEVSADPAVADAYLGHDSRAIHRSGATPGTT